uniref:Macrophage-expressed gene 1 protein n=1 Tax=Panagrellus redivivus TaxID=6233 RepID=A0A7E4W4K1_PANRE
MWLFTLSCLFPIVFSALTGRDRFYRELVDKVHFHQSAVNGIELCRFHSKEINMLKHTPKAALRNVVGRSMNVLTNTYHFTIFAETFKKCDFTPDNRFMIPDSYRVEAIYKRKIDKSVTTESKEHSESKGKSDGGSVGASVKKGGASVKGSLSTIHSTNKRSMNKNSKTAITMSVTNKMYIVTIDRAAKFSSHFSFQLEEIKEAIKNEFYAKARYLTQMMLADYGTEVTTRAMVGSKITYTSLVSSSLMETEESKQTEIKMSVEVKSKGKGKVGGGGGLTTGDSNSKSESNSAMDTTIYLQGGGGIEVLKGDNALSDLLHDDIPVAIETETMPIYTFLLDGSVTNMTSEQLLRLRMFFEDATNEFIERNTIPGCTDSRFANFDYQTCEPYPETLQFDKELEKIGSKRESLCKKYQVKFPLPDCPARTKRKLIIQYTHTLPDTIISKRKFDCGWANGKHICNSTEVTITLKDRLNITAYWCAPTIKESHSAVAFGGYFDPGQVNNFLGQSACADYMTEITLFHGTSICVMTMQHRYAPYLGELTRLFSSDDERPYCDLKFSKQLITVVDGTKIYACLLKKNAFYNLDAPQMIKGPFIKWYV